MDQVFEGVYKAFYNVSNWKILKNYKMFFQWYQYKSYTDTVDRIKFLEKVKNN